MELTPEHITQIHGHLAAISGILASAAREVDEQATTPLVLAWIKDHLEPCPWQRFVLQEAAARCSVDLGITVGSRQLGRLVAGSRVKSNGRVYVTGFMLI